MKKIIAFSGSNSSKSISHQLVCYAASLCENSEVIKLTDHEIPIYGIDIEEEKGIPEGVKQLHEKLVEAGRILISTPEHNGNFPAFFKSILDWLSRNDLNFLKDKEVILLSTSPGKRGAATALGILEAVLPRFGAIVKSTLSIGNFHEVFKDEALVDEEVNRKLIEILKSF